MPGQAASQAQGDIADLAVEDLRKWGCWDLADRVLGLKNTPAFEVPVVRRSVLRYALCCKGSKAAQRHVSEQRKKDPQGVADAEEMTALMDRLQGASVNHPCQLVRELASFERGVPTGLQPTTRLAEYEGPALEPIEAASATIARKAPRDLPAFRAFIVEVAEVVANANREGGFAGIGAARRTPAEAAAIERIKQALGA